MNDIEIIKSKLDIVEFISEFIQLKKTGRNFKANCPFHSEKTPSFVVSAERQTWHCFGACNEGGDVISFLQKWENIEFVEALKMLAKRTGVQLTHFVPTEGSALKEKLYEINHLAAEFYHFILTSHPFGRRAKEYVSIRHIKDQTVKTFLLGYSPASWDSLLKYLTKKGYNTADMHTAGLLTRTDSGRYYDRFRGRLMFPLKDPRGNIIAFAGRKIPPDDEKEAKYINTTETPVYIKGNTLYGLETTKEYIKKEKLAIVVEGEIDLISSFQAGVGNIVAIKGSALTEGQTLLLKRYTEQIVLALDSDFAGNEAARRGIEIAEEAGLTVKVAQLPYGKDPAECVEKSPHLWKEAIEKAVPIYDFVLTTAFTKYDKTDVFGKKKIGGEVLPFISRIQNLIVQSHYVKLLAKELGVTEESIIASLKDNRKTPPHSGFVEKKVVKNNREMMLEEHILALILQSNTPHLLYNQIFSLCESTDFILPPIRKIVELLGFYFQSHTDLDVSLFGKTLPPEIIPVFDHAYLLDMEQILSNKNKLTSEVLESAKALRLLSLRRRINNFSTNIKQLEEKGEEKEVDRLQEQSRLLLVQITLVEKMTSFPVQ